MRLLDRKGNKLFAEVRYDFHQDTEYTEKKLLSTITNDYLPWQSQCASYIGFFRVERCGVQVLGTVQ